MGKRSSSALALFFLLIASPCSHAFVEKEIVYYRQNQKNWTEARLFCQKNHIDLMAESEVGGLKSKTDMANWDELLWIGLLRDPEDESIWRWINPKSGQGLSEGNLSQSSRWADGQPSRHCAFVENDSKWQSRDCSHKYHFYCSAQSRVQYHQVSLDWAQASIFCQDISTDMAVINAENADELQERGWIGLYREAGETWSWIRNQTSDYRNWEDGQPLTTDCGSFHPVHGTWHSKACSKKLGFVCYDDNLVVVEERKTWEEALAHCRSMETPCENHFACRYDLLTLEPSDVEYVRHRIYRATTDEVWIGLRFLGQGWLWINGKKTEDWGTLPHCPSQWRHCGTLSKNDTDVGVITRDCSERRNFICHRSKFGQDV